MASGNGCHSYFYRFNHVTMKITLDRLNQGVHLRATNEEGNSIEMDGSPEIGGEGKGPRPMQVLLMSLAGCSSMDVLSILKKMREQVSDYKVEVNGDRAEGVVPSIFTQIHVHYIISGHQLNPANVEKAIRLSMEKYCSVTRQIEPTAKITYSSEILEV
jgi:putative redox protein